MCPPPLVAIRDVLRRTELAQEVSGYARFSHVVSALNVAEVHSGSSSERGWLRFGGRPLLVNAGAEVGYMNRLRYPYGYVAILAGRLSPGTCHLPRPRYARR